MNMSVLIIFSIDYDNLYASIPVDAYVKEKENVEGDNASDFLNMALSPAGDEYASDDTPFKEKQSIWRQYVVNKDHEAVDEIKGPFAFVRRVSALHRGAFPYRH